MKLLTVTRGAAVGGVLTLLHVPVALGYTGGAAENKPLHLTVSGLAHAHSSSSGGSIVRTIVGLAIVIAVIYGLSWIMRQAKGQRHPAKGSGLEQLATLPLGPNRSVSLVRVGTELHLLGIAEHGVTRIRTYSEDEAVSAGLPVVAPGETVFAEDRGGGRGPIGPIPRGRGLGGAIETLRRITVR